MDIFLDILLKPPQPLMGLFFLLFPTLGKIPTFSYFFRFLLKLIDKNAIFKPQNFFASLCLAYFPSVSDFPL